MILTTLRTSLTALERILDYQGKGVEQEPAWELPRDASLADWPPQGRIEFRGVSLFYRPGLSPALDDVSFVLPAGHRVGIIGRTGAGKSSLMALLFRLWDPTMGSVLLDGVDISMVGLMTLRQSLVVVPQEPLLLQGTVRINLDPFSAFSDAELGHVLSTVSLLKPLDTKVTAGNGISAGESQLLALARTLLRGHTARVVVCDEPTSNVDLSTDYSVQKALRAAYKYATVLTVAHRLETIMDNSLLLVLEEGRMLEFDSPLTLASNSSSYLAEMLGALCCARRQQLLELAGLSLESRAELVSM